MLRKVLNTILFGNLVGAKPVMKVIRAVYIEFSLDP
jgi:hypothetical protein